MPGDDLHERLRPAREAAIRGGERIAAGRQAIAAGTAEPVVYESLHAAYERAEVDPSDLSDSLRGYAEVLVLQALDKALRDGGTPQAEGVGAAAASDIRDAVEFERDGGATKRAATKAQTERKLARVRRPTPPTRLTVATGRVCPT